MVQIVNACKRSRQKNAPKEKFDFKMYAETPIDIINPAP
jgi:hypothetical protein